MTKLKDWEDLTISDNFLFQKVMQNKRICKTLIQKIIGIEIKDIIYPIPEKTIAVTAFSKSVRLDLYVETDKGEVIDIEMQVTNGADGELAHRMRYYQSMIDLEALEKGKDYAELKRTYVIFICTFDPFKLGRKIYTFTNRCHEEKELELNDGATKMFLNAKGKEGKVDKDIDKFLAYIDGKAAEGVFTKDVDEEVSKVKQHKETRLEYMTLMMELKRQRREGYDEGHSAGERIGIEHTKVANALTMFADNFPVDKVAKYSHLSIEEATNIGKQHGYL